MQLHILEYVTIKILSQTFKDLNFENKSLFCDIKDIKNRGILNSIFGKNCGK